MRQAVRQRDGLPAPDVEAFLAVGAFLAVVCFFGAWARLGDGLAVLVVAAALGFEPALALLSTALV
ncbi:hypothetical protein, partial [Gilvimarinus sp. 1_MG-2023]|uniref:hypothetical protein n=1 Tax=Gilvimarinus sp. 1_MG-2023 TaxID=3062638 RepID=UPI0026E32810